MSETETLLATVRIGYCQVEAVRHTCFTLVTLYVTFTGTYTTDGVAVRCGGPSNTTVTCPESRKVKIDIVAGSAQKLISKEVYRYDF